MLNRLGGLISYVFKGFGSGDASSKPTSDTEKKTAGVAKELLSQNSDSLSLRDSLGSNDKSSLTQFPQSGNEDKKSTFLSLSGLLKGMSSGAGAMFKSASKVSGYISSMIFGSRSKDSEPTIKELSAISESLPFSAVKTVETVKIAEGMTREEAKKRLDNWVNATGSKEQKPEKEALRNKIMEFLRDEQKGSSFEFSKEDLETRLFSGSTKKDSAATNIAKNPVIEIFSSHPRFKGLKELALAGEGSGVSQAFIEKIPEYFPNLTHVDAVGIGLTDMTPFFKLEKLEELNLKDNNIQDFPKIKPPDSLQNITVNIDKAKITAFQSAHKKPGKNSVKVSIPN